MSTQKILLSMGTRPEIIKMLPVYFELKRRNVQPVLLHTGQHSDMADSLYDLFGVTPDYSIDLDRTQSTTANGNEKASDLAVLSSLLLHKISAVTMEVNPSMVLVHGDTSSALMGAMAAFYQKIPVAHVEAGLRSHNAYDPFPEEKNRVLIAQLAKWHFAPSARAKQNLLSEGVAESDIYMVGNTIVEAARMGAKKLLEHKNKIQGTESDLVDQLSSRTESHKIVMVTVHRRENQERNNIQSIAQAIVELLKKHDDMIVVWAVHPNPKVKEVVHKSFANLQADISSRLHLTEPLSYPVLLWVLKNSWMALTDSGGIQEEAVALNTPVLVLRDTTERQEIIEVGAGKLIGTEKNNIIAEVNSLRTNVDMYNAMCNAENPFGDGTTADSICNILLKKKLKEVTYANAA